VGHKLEQVGTEFIDLAPSYKNILSQGYGVGAALQQLKQVSLWGGSWFVGGMKLAIRGMLHC
jgi:hypothetical protein